MSNAKLTADNWWDMSPGRTEGAAKLLKRCIELLAWRVDFAMNVLYAYKDFLECKAFVKDWDGTRLEPSIPVYQMWNQHILDTQCYAEDCKMLFGNTIHYNPNHYKDHKGRSERIARTMKLISECNNGSFLDPMVWSYGHATPYPPHSNHHHPSPQHHHHPPHGYYQQPPSQQQPAQGHTTTVQQQEQRHLHSQQQHQTPPPPQVPPHSGLPTPSPAGNPGSLSNKRPRHESSGGTNTNPSNGDNHNDDPSNAGHHQRVADERNGPKHLPTPRSHGAEIFAVIPAPPRSANNRHALASENVSLRIYKTADQGAMDNFVTLNRNKELRTVLNYYRYRCLWRNGQRLNLHYTPNELNMGAVENVVLATVHAEELITMWFHDWKGGATSRLIKMGETFSAAFEEVAVRLGFENRTRLAFSFRGNTLNESSTPMIFQLDDGDQIDVALIPLAGQDEEQKQPKVSQENPAQQLQTSDTTGESIASGGAIKHPNSELDPVEV